MNSNMIWQTVKSTLSWAYFVIKGFWRDRFYRSWIELVITVVIILIPIVFLVGNLIYAGETLPNTIAGGLDVGGLGKTELKIKLDEHLDGRKVTLSYDGTLVTFSPEQLGIGLNPADVNELTIRASWFDWLKPWFRKQEILIPLTIDQTMFQTAVEDMQLSGIIFPVNAKIIVNSGQLQIVEQVPGEAFDMAVLAQDIQSRLSDGTVNLTFELTKQSIQPDITTESLDTAIAKLNLIASRQYSITGPRGTTHISKAQLLSFFDFSIKDGNSDLSLQTIRVSKYVEDLVDQNYIPPVNRIMLEYTSGKSAEQQRAGVNGIEVINSDKVAAGLIQAIQSSKDYAAEFDTRSVPFPTDWRQIRDL